MMKLQRQRRSAGFTVLEMLIAMAVTLLMMAALGRAFKLIGDTMQQSRANVEMSSRLRTISFRIRDELARTTTKMAPPRAASEGEGYLCYYDGPMTDATTVQSALMGTVAAGGDARYARDDTQQALAGYYPLSRFGDLDDYLAFTAASEDGTAFKGVVPNFVIQYKEREYARQEALRQGVSLAQVNMNLPYPPTLTDAVALQPVVIESKYAEIAYWVSPERVGGVIIDVDNDTMPDRLYLRRRVLLIRPDLNSQTVPFVGELPSYTDSNGTVHMVIASGLRPMTVIHGQCDLSVRRPEDPNGIPLPVGGATAEVIANSIADLTLPQNRFAHIRVPERTAPLVGDVNGNSNVDLTSMPVLDLMGLEGLLAQTAVATASDAARIETGGFLNPAYELTGNRLGEDIVLANIVGFDVRGYDSQAPLFLHVGPDGFPGSEGDDDGDGQADGNDTDNSEFGVQGSDDVILSPSDPGFYSILRAAIGGNNATSVIAARGAFVDLNYVYKPGGNVLAPLGLDAANLSGTPLVLRNNLSSFCETPLSGFSANSSLGVTNGWLVPESALRSGKLVLGAANSGIRPALINQFTYDTWALDYETDQHNQGFIRGTGNVAGTLWPFNTSAGTTHTYDPRTGGTWPNQLDEGANGIDEPGSSPGVDDFSEREVPPPIPYAMPGIQLRLRIIDPATQEMRQTTVTQYLNH